MTNEEYIRKAVELAPEMGPWDFFQHNPERMDEITQHDLDALAAQLVRQVDIINNLDEEIGVFARYVTKQEPCEGGGMEISVLARGPDRTMNTIKAIVDSGVLE